MSVNTNGIFTGTMAAADVITVRKDAGFIYISVLCKTDGAGARGITILGEAGLNGTLPTAITLLANESITIQSPDGRNLGALTVTAGDESTGIVVAM
jgi:hypothetical protein